MITDILLLGRARLVGAGFLFGVLAVTGSCRDSVGVDGGGGDDEGPAALIVSDPLTPRAPTSPAALLAPSVAYVSLPPGTIPNGLSATISNRRTAVALTVSLVAGGLDPVPIAAETRDTLDFAIDVGATAPERFARPVPEFLKVKVVRTEPPAGKRDVPLNLRVRIVFSEPVNPATVTSVTLGLQQAGIAIGGEVAVSADGLEASFLPAADLLPETDYTIAVGDGIRDSDGSQLESPVTAGFTTGALPAEPPPLPPPGALAFTDGAGDIYVMNTDGSDRRRLTSDAAPFVLDAYAAWSPDGSRIAFSRYDGYHAAEVYLINADGTNQVRLSPQGAYDAHPSWSPDGSRIAFENRQDSVSNGEIYVMNADGTNRVRLTDNPQPDASPAWSPDGNRIAYWTYSASGNADIYVMNADGTNRVNLTDDAAFDTEPAWSPDGSRIAFSRSVPGGTDLSIVNADGTNLVRLTTLGWVAQPSWSPDGQVIAFTLYPPCDDPNPVPADPKCFQPVKVLMIRVTDRHIFDLPQPGGSAFYPSWRP